MNMTNTLDWMGKSTMGQMAASGQLFIIRCVPDPFTAEVLNIGVCAVDAQGQRVAKVLTEPGRLSCLYGEAASQVVALAAVAKEAAETGGVPPSTQIVFDAPTPYYGTTAQEAAAMAFADQVTVALPQRAQAAVKLVDDEAAMQSVTDAIKLHAGLDFDLLANTPQVLIQTEKGPRTLRVPLQPRNGVGTIRSAYYSAQSLKTHLMDSVLDMECAARYRAKKHMGLFVLRPEHASRQVNAALDNVIDSVAYRAPANMVLEVAYTPQSLAADIAKWAKTASA